MRTARRPLVLAAALTVAVGALAGCGKSEPGGLERRAADAASQRATQARAAARQAGLAPAVQDVVADAAGASGHRFAATYDIGGRTATFVQLPPFRRLEVADAPVPGDAQAAIVNASGSFSCRRTNGTWTCQADGSPSPPVGALSVSDMVATVQSLTASAQQFDLRVETQTIAGTRARCLVSTPRAGAGGGAAGGGSSAGAVPERLCVAANGAPLEIASGSQVVRATTYRASASTSAFDLPARPTPSTTTG